MDRRNDSRQDRDVRTAGGARSALTCRPGRRGAFSLLELMLVVAIVSVVAAIAVPRYAASQTRYRAESAAQRIAASLNYAREHARQASKSVTVVLDASADELQIVGVGDLNDSTTDFRLQLRRAPLEADLISADFGGDATVIFSGFGLPDSGGTVVVRAGTWERTVVLDADTGRASVP